MSSNFLKNLHLFSDQRHDLEIHVNTKIKYQLDVQINAVRQTSQLFQKVGALSWKQAFVTSIRQYLQEQLLVSNPVWMIKYWFLLNRLGII